MADARASGEYVLKPHEQPLIPGSPANPDHPLHRRYFYFAIGLFLGLVSGFQNGLLLANLTLLQSHMGLTPADAGWVTVAYNMTNTCMSILLFKGRQHFGIQRFVRLTMLALVIANFLQLFDAGYRLELIARGISGIAASGLVTMAIFYMMQSLPGPKKMIALILGIGMVQLGTPLARAISPLLVYDGDITSLFAFQFGLSLVAVGAVNILPLPQGIKVRAFGVLDMISFPLLAIGVGLLCAFLVQGRIVWWPTPWLGGALALSVVLIGASFLIEHNRANPMLLTRWIASSDLVKLAFTGALVRVVLSEQSFGASGLLTSLGLVNDQLVTYYVVTAAAALLGVFLPLVRLNPLDLRTSRLVSLAIISIAAFADTHSGLNTRPINLYMSQAAIAFASVYFIGPMLMEGFLRALTRGPAYVVSFLAIFNLSQTIGGLFGTAALSAFFTIRTKAHLMTLAPSLQTDDPALAQAINGLAASLNGTIGDPALRAAVAGSNVVREAARQAAVLAYNDVFFVIGALSGLAFVIMFARWLYDRRRGFNPLAADLFRLQQMLAQRQ
ncbi:MFS transporter [Sphingopyxis sp. BSN-002]|uniref:MFS transporter n=1 Tax=Sphingopyxis sp. BSN-002 TaxID=2911495 RepID=UPI001ED9D285|nr:MFS transporter [Sphingopyxis sp. BSN-002]UKK84165.1 MFS transporter [Sphingopyxis sp. BSN-002]